MKKQFYINHASHLKGREFLIYRAAISPLLRRYGEVMAVLYKFQVFIAKIKINFQFMFSVTIRCKY